MRHLSRSYTPHIGCLWLYEKDCICVKLWITREKLWIKGLNWGEFVRFDLSALWRLPPHMGGSQPRSPTGLNPVWDGENLLFFAGILPQLPGDSSVVIQPHW
jgi:hypothetical protein